MTALKGNVSRNMEMLNRYSPPSHNNKINY